MAPPIREWSGQATLRLIPSGRARPPALSRLGDTFGALQDLAALEGMTNDRLAAGRSAHEGIDASELVPAGTPNATFINAAFCHPRETGNRFNSGQRGAWYAALEIETSLAEVAFHLTRELEAIGRFENATDYVALHAQIDGRFHDLTDARWQTHLALNPDPAVGYAAGQSLARELFAQGSDGIIYPSCRRPGGLCVAVFRPRLIRSVVQGGLWRLTWEGSPQPTITEIAGGDVSGGGGESR